LAHDGLIAALEERVDSHLAALSAGVSRQWPYVRDQVIDDTYLALPRHAGMLSLVRSASFWMAPSQISPCSPSPLTSATARPMSARSSSSKRACPKFLRQVQPPGHRRPLEADRRSTTCRGAGLQAHDRTGRRGHGRIRHDAQLS
jgi:hypothetical protein